MLWRTSATTIISAACNEIVWYVNIYVWDAVKAHYICLVWNWIFIVFLGGGLIVLQLLAPACTILIFHHVKDRNHTEFAHTDTPGHAGPLVIKWLWHCWLVQASTKCVVPPLAVPSPPPPPPPPHSIAIEIVGLAATPRWLGDIQAPFLFTECTHIWYSVVQI